MDKQHKKPTEHPKDQDHDHSHDQDHPHHVQIQNDAKDDDHERSHDHPHSHPHTEKGEHKIEEKQEEPKNASTPDRTTVRRRASELKVNEKKRIRSMSLGHNLDLEKAPGGTPTTTEDNIPKASKRDRSITGTLGKKTKGWRSKLMKSHTLDRNFSIENGVLMYNSGKTKEASFKTPLDEVKAYKLDIKNDIKKGRFAFQIETPKRNFVLYSDTEEEREHWLMVLKPRKDGEGDASSVSRLDGLGDVVVGEPIIWTLVGIDKYNQLCVEGGNKVVGTIKKSRYTLKTVGTGSSGLAKLKEMKQFKDETVEFVDNNDGTYIAKIVPYNSYFGQLKIEVENDEIKGSPFPFVVKPGEPCLQSSSMKGAGLTDPKMYVSSRIEIEILDKHNNPSLGHLPEVKITNKEGEDANFNIKLETNPEFEHIHEVIYIADKQGEFIVLVSVNGESWGKFPVLVTKAPASAAKSSATGPGLKKVYQYKQTTFKVFVNDERGKKCEGDHPILCKFSTLEDKPLGNFESKVTRNEDDTWSVSYVPTVGGSVLLRVYLYEQEIQGSPFSVDVAPAKGAIDKCTISGPGLTATELYQTTHFTVTVNDQTGRRVNQASVGVAFGGKQVEFQVINNGDGTFQVTFTPNSPGLLIMSVSVDGKQIKGSPFQLNISEAAQVSPEMCYAEGEGVKECIRYRRSTFSVFLRDEKNNPISKGNLSVFMKGTTEFQYSMANAGNGSYWVRYKTTAEPGEYKLFVTVDGQQIRGSPFFVTIEPGREEDETSLNAGFPRLLRISTSGKTVLSTLVPLSGSSLNSDDVFLLDNELTIFQWNSPNSSRVLKLSAGQIVKVLNYDRRSALVHHIIEHKEHLASLDSSSHHGEKELQLFFELLNEDSNEWTNPNKRFVGDSKEEGFLPKIYSVDDQENLELLVEGGGIKADLFRPDKLLILDTGFEIFSWEGRNCPNNLKRYAFQAGKDYVKQFKRPEGIIVTHILEGSEKWTMKHFMNQENHL